MTDVLTDNRGVLSEVAGSESDNMSGISLSGSSDSDRAAHGKNPICQFLSASGGEQLITLGKGKISEVRAGLRLVDKRTGERLKSLQTDAD